MKLIFYDFETTGRNYNWDQIIQVGAVITNEELEEIDNFECSCMLKPGVVPEPAALLVNKRIPGEDTNLSHYNLVKIILEKTGPLLKENAELLGRTETIDSGKLLKETKFATEYVREYFHFYADLAEKMENEFPIPKIDKPDMDVVEVREPIGVVACIIPWNQQMFFFLNN